jgi:hypothetical protein
VDKLIYEDVPYFQQGRYLIAALTIVMMVTILVLASIWKTSVWLYLLLVPLIFGFTIAWARWPRKYQIFENKIRIVCGSPFHFDVPFNNLEYGSEADQLDTWLPLFRWNFVTHRHKNIVTIVRKNGMKINITPNNPELFLENLKKALADWRRIYEQ